MTLTNNHPKHTQAAQEQCAEQLNETQGKHLGFSTSLMEKLAGLTDDSDFPKPTPHIPLPHGTQN